MRRLISILIPAFLFSAGVFAQQVEVSARLDTASMLIGDHVGLTLKFAGPAGSQVLWPFIPDTILGNISVIGRGKIDTTYSADRKTVSLTQEINLTCFDSGFYTIPQIPMRYRIPPDTTILTATCQLIPLMVHTVSVDTSQAIKGIKGPMSVPITFRELLPWILAGLAVAALVVAIVWFLKKRKKQEPVFQLRPRVKLLPHEQALQELEQLRAKKLWQTGKTKEYHSELTEILRRYIENRFNVPALEQTTAEITENLMEQVSCPKEALKALVSILFRADLVKFAKMQPLPDENEQSMTAGIGFVRDTSAHPSGNEPVAIADGKP